MLSGLQITLLITPLASSSFSCPFSFGYCVVWPSNYGFWLPLWRLQAFLVLFHLVIVLSGLQMTASDYPFGVFKLFLSFFVRLLCCLAFKWRLLITPLASSSFSCPFSFGYCVVWSSNYGFWLPLWHLQTFLVLMLVIVLSGLQITASDYPFGIFKPFLSFFFWLLCCLAFQLRLLITPLVSSNFSYPFSFGYCVVWPSNYGFWLPLWRLQAFLVLFLLVIVLSGFPITLLITPLASSNFSYPFSFGYCVVWPSKVRLLITPLASSSFSCPFSFGYCVVWPSNYASDYPFGVFKLFLSFFFWLLCCVAFKLRLLIIPLASSSFSCPFSFGYCVVWPSNYGFWLSLWRLQAFLVLFPLVIVLSGLPITLMFTRLASSSFSCPFSFGYCVVWPSNYAFWLPLWRLQAFLVLFLLVIVLSGLQITASDSPFWHLQAFLALFLLVIVLSGL